MKTLFLECNAGASGDMLLGALSGLIDSPEDLREMLASAGIPGIEVSLEKTEKNHISGLKVHISVNGMEEGHEHNGHAHHPHHRLCDVLGIIDSLNVSEKVKHDAHSIYETIAEAESQVHGKPVDLVHFHEVGALDAVADIVGACMLFEKISAEKIVCTPLRTGFGQVRCAHGVLPVPAPATAMILKNVPSYAGDEEGEFSTPTGVAIIKHFAEEYGQMPTMTFDKVGIGLGDKQFRTTNMLRAFIGNVEENLPTIKEIDCNIDDMSPEDMGRIIDLLLDNGALDAFISPCIMKKGRPGYGLTCLCRNEDLDRIAKLILVHTSTIGLRAHDCERYAMTSRFETVETMYGPIRVKISEGFGAGKVKAEYDDVLEASKKYGVPLSTIRAETEHVFKYR